MDTVKVEPVFVSQGWWLRDPENESHVFEGRWPRILTVDGSEIPYRLLSMKPFETWNILRFNWLAGFLPSTVGYMSFVTFKGWNLIISNLVMGI